ncbi:MAG: methionyl-tRNA formyltransferase [Candidatus Omnitrophica bacterium 4484_49]|nr:MAG: methionyl-tRNA formyltransferase [Candidatus Omnitrophica bacterium 4484_49]
MRIVFFGSGNFSIPVFEYLCNQKKHQLLAVVTQPDKKGGRGYKVQHTPVKEYVLKNRISTPPVFQPQDVNSVDFIRLLRNLTPDLFIVASFGQIFKREALSLPRIFAINIHASLLPRYRGAAPVNWAIINGEEITGVTIFKMNERMDAGEIISQRECNISFQDTAVTLEKKLADIGRDLLHQTLNAIVESRFQLRPQHGKPSYAPRLKKQDGFIHWKRSALEIYNLIRGTQPWPGAYTYFQEKLLKIFTAEIIKMDEGMRSGNPGEILDTDKEGFIVACGSGSLRIKELQPESRKRMSAREFISGYRIKPGMKLGP